MKNITTTLFLTAIILVVGCKTQQDSATEAPTRGDNRGQERPSIDEIFRMDANQDGMLAPSEVKGPLKNDFSKIDTNGDGFISRQELESAPKPPRGQRPSGGNRG